MIIRNADDARAVLGFYHDLIDKMRDRPIRPTWTKGVYPLLGDLQAAIDASGLFIATVTEDQKERIVGAVVVTDREDEAYKKADWAITTQRVAVIHLLASDPDRHGMGIGRSLLEKARTVAAERNAEVIRLDTLPYNTPARRLYESFGFQYRGDIEIYYPSAGTIPFSMYEYLL